MSTRCEILKMNMSSPRTLNVGDGMTENYKQGIDVMSFDSDPEGALIDTPCDQQTTSCVMEHRT
jgi:hypothetical protein